MSRKTTARLSNIMDQLVFPLLLISITALFPYVVQGIVCDSDLQCSACNVTANNTQYCTECPDGLGLLNDPPNPTKCTDCGTRCQSCKVIGQVCPLCVDTFGPIFSGSGIGSCGACVSVAANCVGGCNVNGAGRCDNCDKGFGLTNGNTSCDPCVLNCLVCDTNISYCDQCKATYYLFPQNRTCGHCADRCTQYKCSVNGAGKCDQCDNGYGLTATKTCELCASNCIVYGCAVNGAGKCDHCDLGYSLTSTNTCASCSPNCNASIGCNSPNTCITCNLGYGRLPNGTCDVCAPNCTTYGCAVNGAGQCDRCDTGFNRTLNNTCTPICSPNCNVSGGCLTPNTCITCNVGYGLLPNGTCDACASNCTRHGCLVNGAGKCDHCDLGFALTSTNTCAPCSMNCNVSVGCDSPNTCITCNLGYGRLPNGTCDVCAPNCTTNGCAVNGAMKCDICDQGFNLTSTNTCTPICSPHCNVSGGCLTPNTCITCNVGYGLLPNGTCDTCASNCTKYGCVVKGAGKCDHCDLGFALTANNTCAPCSMNCNVSVGCDSPNTCITCNLGYGRLPNGTCYVCGNYCIMAGCAMNGAEKCDVCDTGYELTMTNTCIPIATTRLPTQILTTTSMGGAHTTVASSALTMSANSITTGGSTGGTNGTGGTDGTVTSTAFGGSGVTSAQSTFTTTNSRDLNSNSSSSIPPIMASPSGSNSPPTDEIDWRILLTLLMLVLGGIFVTIVSVLCWSSRFYLDADGDIRRQRRRIYLVKES